MKKILLTFIIALAAVPAMAQWHHHHCCYRGGWVGPALIGGVVGYELSRPRTVVVEQPIIVQQPQQPIIVPSAAPAGYHWQQMINPQTNQYQLVLVPN
jgi:hypothetical protein